MTDEIRPERIYPLAGNEVWNIRDQRTIDDGGRRKTEITIWVRSGAACLAEGDEIYLRRWVHIENSVMSVVWHAYAELGLLRQIDVIEANS